MRTLPSPLLVITDRHQARGKIEAVPEAVARGGGSWLMLRDRDLAAGERASLAARLAGIARDHGVHLSIGGDIALAALLGASAHLQSAAAIIPARARLGSAALIGVSAHSEADVAAAAAAGADYVTLSPIFLTDSKPGYGPALGLAAISAAAKLGIPVLALGGVRLERVRPCLSSGAQGIAVMGEIMRSGDPGRTVREFLAACKAAT